MVDADAAAAQELVQARQRLEDAGMLLLVGLVGIAAVGRGLAEIAGRPRIVDLGEDEGEAVERILDVQMQDIADQLIPGITGGALDSDEGAPGPILLQGDHLPIEYRNIRLTPAKR